MAQPLCFGQISLAASECLFYPLSLGDVPPHAAVADETSRFVKYRQPIDRHIALATVGRRPRELEIAERQVGVERLPVPTPAFCIGLEIGHLPSRLANLGDRRLGKRLGELLHTDSFEAPVERGGRYFFRKRLAGQDRGAARN